ncbi:FAD-dependent monooxygenase [Paraburkholderia phenazinium]|jgi:2-polyprenyl-6-methoxyphenol hydroxylase-like FAD-dependent oxidoreductase|uniref:FAD-dependent monooxygenase n=1 Tax=Paraburkholderia phenazinium TaxID=60549 RepID=UPI00158EDC64|nr:FAD-dependent monooxygenase [Paraburkholderia phenazinium]
MTTTIDTDVLIVGGGIGGLSTALALHAQGVRDLLVIEAANPIRPLGVGINIQPAAVAELYALGLNRALERSGIKTERVAHLDENGTLLWSEPRGLPAGSPYPQISIHRGALEMFLLRAVKGRLGRNSVRMGIRLLSFLEDGDDSVRAIAIDQSTGKEVQFRAKGLIGADGIHSAVRAQLQGDGNKVNPTPVMMWRGVTEVDRFLDGRTMIVANDVYSTRLIAYPISGEHSRRGTDLINWVCMVSADARAQLNRPDWTELGKLEDILPYFSHWNIESLDIADMLSRSRAILQYPMVDRDPLEQWGGNRVTLLGDAAHLMYPVGAHGASQTILDASTLAFEIAHQKDIGTAFANYESARRPITSKVVIENRNRDRAERASSVSGSSNEEKTAAVKDLVSRYKQNVEGR